MKKALLMFCSVVLIFFLVSCDPSGPGTIGSSDTVEYASNVVPVESNIETAVTWLEGKVYYIDEVIRVVNGGTLVIEPGAVVKFSTNGLLSAESGSRIQAEGQAQKTIVFTSIFDNTAGGDSILNDGSALPLKGDWSSISIESGAVGSSFLNCQFRYGGKDKAAVLLIEGRASVQNCVFRDNLGGHPYDSNLGTAALDALRADPATIITGNVFYRNLWPLAINGTMSLDSSNAFSYDEDNDAGTPDEVNTHQGIYVGDNDINSTVAWSETEVPLCFFGFILRVKSTGTLTIASGAVIKSSTADFQFEYGSTVTRTGVTFTSFRDDSLLGDTNADGTASAPVDGDWIGIEVEDSGNNLSYLPNDSWILYSAEGL